MENTIFKNNIQLFDDAAQQQYYDTFEGLVPAEKWLISTFFPKGSLQLLDMGCGAARTTIEFNRMGYITTGIDLSSSLLDKAQKRYPQLNLRYMDATQTAFENEQFDIVVFSFNGIDSIYPVSLRSLVFEEAYRLLKPNGLFYYTSHSASGMIRREWKAGKKGIKKILRFFKDQSSLKMCLNGFWNYKEGGVDNFAYSKSARFNINQLDPQKWKILQVIGSDRFTKDEYQVLFDGEKWSDPDNKTHNHFLLQKRA